MGSRKRDYIYIQRERQFESKVPSFYLQLVKKIPFEINKAGDKNVVDFYLSYNHYQVPTTFDPRIKVGNQQLKAGIYVVNNKTGIATINKYNIIGATNFS